VSNFFGDSRYALRLLFKSPIFSATVIIVLALGIGANSAVFSVVDAVLLRALPYRAPDRLVMVWEKNPTLGTLIGDRVPPAYSNFIEWQRRARTFESLGGFEDTNLNLTSGGEPERVDGARATANFFDVLGVNPQLGSGFGFAATDAARTRVAIISDGFFKRRFGGQASVIEQALILNDIAFTVVGVLPAEFHLPASREGGDQHKPDIWIPYDRADNANPTEFNRRRMQVYGRLASGATLEQARAEMRAIAQRLAEENPAQDAGYSANVFPVAVEDIGPDLRRNLFVLLAAVGFVLLIACANLANLMLARATTRQREMAIRKALGASRTRLVSPLLAESMLLSVIGAALGLLIAHLAIKGLVMLQPAGINRPEEIHLNGVVVLFTASITVVVAVLFGIFPALQAARTDMKNVLSPVSNARTTLSSRRLRRFLIMAEVALACVLLIAATFMMKSLGAVLRVDPGFWADHLLTMKFSMPPSRYPDNKAVAAFCQQVLEKVSALPGVTSASFSDGLPLTRIRMTRFTVEGRAEPLRGSESTADMRGIFSPSYLDTLGLRLISGRNFAADEIEQRRPVVLMNQTLARQLWPHGSAVGQHIRSVPSKTAPSPVVSTVIGVVADTHQSSLEDETRPEITKPMVDFTQLTLAVRGRPEPLSLVAAVKTQIWSIDRYLPVFEVQTMQQLLDSSTSQRRFNSMVMAVFATLALLLAGVGIYGVLSSLVTQRTREIGIRMALGAQARNVLGMIVREGLLMVSLGLVIGVAGGFGLARFLASIFFAVSPTETTTYLQVATLLVAIAFAACLLPAWRALSVNPVEALRHE
jgi:predicted permease